MMAPVQGSTMPVWSSPFPCDLLQELERVDFPGPDGSLLVYDSPDRILLSWKASGRCDGVELEHLIQGYEALNELNRRGEHQLVALWDIGDSHSPPPAADGITAALLLLWLQAAPQILDSYLQLDPSYTQRLLLAQSNPRQLLQQWLSQPQGDLIFEDTFEDQLKSTQDELNRLQRSHQKMSTLMAQVKDQQRRTRRLLATMLKTGQLQDN